LRRVFERDLFEPHNYSLVEQAVNVGPSWQLCPGWGSASSHGFFAVAPQPHTARIAHPIFGNRVEEDRIVSWFSISLSYVRCTCFSPVVGLVRHCEVLRAPHSLHSRRFFFCAFSVVQPVSSLPSGLFLFVVDTLLLLLLLLLLLFSVGASALCWVEESLSMLSLRRTTERWSWR